MQNLTFDSLEDDEDLNPFNHTTTTEPSSQLASRRSCVNSKVRWLMFKLLQPILQSEDEVIAAQWILSHCHKQLPYDRNWWSRMERQNGELSLSNPEVSRHVESLNLTLHRFVKQLVSATESVRKYIDGVDPVTNALRKRDWNASTSLSEWISGDRGLLIKKLANNDPDVRKIRQYLPSCLCEDNLKEALHNGGILIYTDQFPSTRVKRALHVEDDRPSEDFANTQLNLIRPGAADTRLLDITLMDGSIIPVRRSRCSLGIPPTFVTDSVMIPKICVYDFSNGLNLFIFYRGHKMGKRKRPTFHVAEQHHLVHSAKHNTRFQQETPSTMEDTLNDESQSRQDSKRLRIESNSETSSFTELLPGVHIPRRSINQVDLKEGHEISENPPAIQIRRRSSRRDDLFGDSSLIGMKSGSMVEQDQIIHVALSTHGTEDDRTGGENWDKTADNWDNTEKHWDKNAENWESTQGCSHAKTNIPVQSVFVGPDNVTYLFSATLGIDIAPDFTLMTKLAPSLSERTTAEPTSSSTSLGSPSPAQNASSDGPMDGELKAESNTQELINEQGSTLEGRQTEQRIANDQNASDNAFELSDQTITSKDQEIPGSCYSPRLLSTAAASLSLLAPSPSADLDIKEIPLTMVAAKLLNITLLAMKADFLNS